jgi:hypothetical protein
MRAQAMPSAMPLAELSEAMIATAMAKADARAGPPGNQRCCGFPNSLEDARTTFTPKGR